MSFCDKHSSLISSIPAPSQVDGKTDVAAKSPTQKLRHCFGPDPFAHRGPLWAWGQGDVQTHEHPPFPDVWIPPANPLSLQLKESRSRCFKQASLKSRKKNVIHDQCDCSLSVIIRGVVYSP